MDHFLEDVRLALRQLRKAPRFAAAAIFTLALGIGVSTAAFTLFYGMLLRPLPVAEPQQLYRIGEKFTCCFWFGYPDRGDDFNLISTELYRNLKAGTPEFQALAATQAGVPLMPVRLGRDSPKLLHVSYVSGNYFTTLGVSPNLGRLFSDADESLTVAHVAVLSERAWRTEFSSDRSIIGSTIFVESHPVVVVGVAQREFAGDRVTDTPPDIWLPLSGIPFHGTQTRQMQSEDLWLWLIGRVRPGADLGALQSKLAAELRQWLSSISYYEAPDERGLIPKQFIVLTPAARGIQDMPHTYRSGLMLLMLLSCLVLLVACANVANLMLVRGATRQPEISLRIALGSPRMRILRQIFAEGLLLSFFAAIVGIGVAWFGSYAVLRLGFPDATSLPVQPAPSVPSVAFTGLAAFLTGVLFSAAPARLSLLSQPVHAMRGYLRSTARLSPLPQKTLIVLQATLSTVLIAVATLTVRTFDHLAYQPTGFETSNRYTMRIQTPGRITDPADLREFYSKVQQRLSRLGGVISVGMASDGPYENEVMANCIVVLTDDGQPHNNTCGYSANQINNQYFEALGVPLLQGRNFNDSDTSSSPQVVIVDQALADRFFPQQNPIGRHIAFNYAPSSSWQIVGISGNIRNTAQDDVPGYYYRPITQLLFPQAPMIIQSIVVHFRNPPEDPEGMIRRALAQVDPDLAISTPRTMDAKIAGSVSEKSLIAYLALVFAISAVTLASLGLYGVTSYIAVQRTAEIAIRIALGSTRLGIIRFVLRSVLGQITLGILIGIPLALAAGYAIRDLLYEVHWYDPIGLLLAIPIMGICSSAAEFIPARRASFIDPAKSLKVE